MCKIAIKAYKWDALSHPFFRIFFTCFVFLLGSYSSSMENRDSEGPPLLKTIMPMTVHTLAPVIAASIIQKSLKNDITQREAKELITHTLILLPLTLYSGKSFPVITASGTTVLSLCFYLSSLKGNYNPKEDREWDWNSNGKAWGCAFLGLITGALTFHNMIKQTEILYPYSDSFSNNFFGTTTIALMTLYWNCPSLFR